MRNFLAICTSLLLAGQAIAGGPTTVAPEPEPVPTPAPVADIDWTGPYVGVMAGNGEFGYGSPAEYSHFGLQLGYLRDLGTLVWGGELAYMVAEQDGGVLKFNSTRLKLIGGASLGRFMPYGFVGASRFGADYGPETFTDTFTIYGVGARFALGSTGRSRIGVEYLVEKDSDFNGNGAPADNSEISIRYDFRF